MFSAKYVQTTRHLEKLKSAPEWVFGVFSVFDMFSDSVVILISVHIIYVLKLVLGLM